MCDICESRYGNDEQAGTVSSPNYPNLYPPSHTSYYQIWIPGAKYITVTFDAFVFQVEHYVEPSGDFLLLGHGFEYLAVLNDAQANPPSTEINIVYKLDGFTVPMGSTVIVGDAMWLYFRTDATTQYRGWRLSWLAGRCDRPKLVIPLYAQKD